MKNILITLRKRPFLSSLLIFILADLLLVRDWHWLTRNMTGVRFWVNYTLAVIGLASWIYLTRRFCYKRPLLKTLGFLFVALPYLIQAGYFGVYKRFFSPFAVGMLEVDTKIAFSVVLSHIPWWRMVLLAGVLGFTASFMYGKPHTSSRAWLPLPLVLLLGVVAHSLFGWYTVTAFQQNGIAFYSAFIDKALRQTSAFKLNKPKVPLNPSIGKTPDIVLVIGESTNYSHLSVFGYDRQTMPHLDSLAAAGQLIPYTHAVSIGNKTNLTIPYLLTGLEGPDPNGRFYHAPTLFDYAKAQGYYNAFVSAQDFKWGHMDKLLIGESVDHFQDGSAFSPRVDVLKGADDLAVLDKGVLPLLAKAPSPLMLVIQMDGSHYPYRAHSPDSMKRFFPEAGNKVNAYDNTILVTDRFLAAIYKALKKRSESAWMVFTPDHGQNLGDSSGLYNDNFLTNVVHNPLMIFPPTASASLIRWNANKPVSQADILPTFLALWNQRPLFPVDGLSLLDSLPASRIRVCSAYMPTFHMAPTAVVFTGLSDYCKIDFRRKSVSSPDRKTAMPYSALAPTIRQVLDARLNWGRP